MIKTHQKNITQTLIKGCEDQACRDTTKLISYEVLKEFSDNEGKKQRIKVTFEAKGEQKTTEHFYLYYIEAKKEWVIRFI